MKEAAATTLPTLLSRGEPDTSLRGDDPGEWGHSMANVAELMLPILDVAGVRSIAEVGAYAGDLTAVLSDWAKQAGATVIAFDPLPQRALIELAERRPEIELIRETSADALHDMPLPDAVVIDGDHNYFTVSEELHGIGSRADGADMPLLLFHDVCWPHGRRDAFYSPERVPEKYRQSIREGVGVFPGEPGVTTGGLPYKWAAAREGGPRNGVLTAIEDFIAERAGLRLATVPVFFGFGVAWHEDSPWASAVAELVDPWDGNPILARLEANRVLNLAKQHRGHTELGHSRYETQVLRDRVSWEHELLRGLLRSKLFATADRLTSLRNRSRGQSWTERIQAMLDQDA